MVSKPKQKEMIGFIIYLVVAFVVFYFTYHKLKNEMIEKVENSYYMEVYDTKEFWCMVVISFIWPLSLPGIGIWKLLDKLTGRSK